MDYKYFAVDFDDTITQNTAFPDIGELRPHAKRVMQRIKDSGGQIAIWTCRGGEHEQRVKDFLEANSIPYDEINRHFQDHLEQFDTQSPKIFSDIYIDDKGAYALMNGGIDWLEIEAFIFGDKKTMHPPPIKINIDEIGLEEISAENIRTTNPHSARND